MPELFDQLRSHPLWQYRHALLCVAFACMLLEIAALAWRFNESYRPRLMVSTTLMWVVEQGGRMLMYPLRLGVFVMVSRLSMLPALHGAAAFAVAYVCVDFLYYWKHRLLHAFAWTWALHSVHHSSDELNLMAAIRLGWVQRFLDDFFYLPLVLLGFDSVLVLLTVELNHASQFWCHTRCIGSLRWLDGVLNTPSNHRVHHAYSRAVADHNYGSTLMCWDVWFGTYLREPARPVQVFGVEGAPRTDNPIAIQLGPLWHHARAWAAHALPRKQQNQ